ncbi:MAG TPA: YkgJ family cysteine cluster protein [Geobacteraceae bacterium]
MMNAKEELANYRQLVAKVDELCGHVTEAFRQNIACRPGCISCCRHLSLFPVEAVAVAYALRELSPAQAARIHEKAQHASPDDPCPLLDDDLCLLYDARPLICRTHGLPIMTCEGDKQHVDFCPMNFQGIDSLPGQAIINVDRLNAALIAINALFVSHAAVNSLDGRGRLTLAEALLLDL